MYAPFILIFHWINLLFYFWRMSHDPNDVYWQDYGWTVYYNSIQNITLAAYLLTFIKHGYPTSTEANFIWVDIFFTFTLIIATIMQYKNVLEHTYGYQISIICMIIATIMIAISFFRHGLHKD